VKLPLEGIRVADFSWVWAGPYCTEILATWGAQVIKFESTRRVDVTRTLAPFGYADPEQQLAYHEWSSTPVMDRGPSPVPEPTPNQSGYFNYINHNKLSATLNLSHPKGTEIAKRVVAVSDVVVENFSTRVMRGFGLDYSALEAVKKDLIYLFLGAVGQAGPYSDYVFYGGPGVSLSGLASLTGYEGGPPMPMPIAFGDPVSGLAGAFAVLVALRHRATTGEGQFIDLSQWEAVVAQLPEGILDYSFNGRLRARTGNHDDIMAPHDVYPCLGDDKWVSIAVRSDEEWRALCEAVGHAEWIVDPRFADGYLRHRNQREVDALLSEWTRERTSEEVTEVLQRAGVAAVPSYTNDEVYNHPQLAARKFFACMDHPETGPRLHPHTQFMINESRGLGGRAPLLGEHNEQIFCGLLGMSQEELQVLINEDVVY